MRAKGINYDTGFLSAGTSTHEPFEPEVTRREMRIIRDDLHCTAVRVTGGDADRLEIAATFAADAGLEVWLCPFTNGLTQDERLALLGDCADRAERLRRGGAEVVLLTGSELSLFTVGFLPGETLAERLALVADPSCLRPVIGEVRARINDFLRRAAGLVRARFGGPLSYASILPLEGVDWAPFDIIATDAAYRTSATAPRYRESIRAFVAQGRAQGKPVAVTEFGCATFRGAGQVAGTADALIEWGGDGRAARLKGECSTTRAAHRIRTICVTPTCRGRRKPRSARWPTGSAADPLLPDGRDGVGLPARALMFGGRLARGGRNSLD